MSQPLTSGADDLMLENIQPGHGMVAKPSLVKLAVQSSFHCTTRVERVGEYVVTAAQTFWSSALSTSTVLSAVWKGNSAWFTIACAMEPLESYHLVLGSLAASFSPAAK